MGDSRLPWGEEVKPLELQSRETLKDFIKSFVDYLAHSTQFSDPDILVVGTPRLRQIRASNDQANLYGVPCDWSLQDKEPKPHAGHYPITKTAWVYAQDAGLPVMQGYFCPIPNTGYYFDLFSPAIANN